jgi:hypothetical protein
MKTEITKKEMAKAIKEKFDAIPDRQVSTGIYIKKIGSRYVTLLNIWGTSTLKKVEIEDFYTYHIG